MRTSFEPDIWGPQTWFFLNSAVLSLPDGDIPDEQQKKIYNFFDSLTYMLPCGSCREHYTEYFNKNSIDISNRDSIWNWLIKLHNAVNIRYNKPVISTEDAKQSHLDGYRSQSNNKIFIIALLVIIAISLYLFLSVSRRS